MFDFCFCVLVTMKVKGGGVIFVKSVCEVMRRKRSFVS